MRSCVLTVLLCTAVPAVCEAQYSGNVLYQITAPSGYNSQLLIYGQSGTQLVGGLKVAGTGSTTFHAFLWDATGSPVDLTPAGFTYSVAEGTDGAAQVGYAMGGSTGAVPHAILWTGSAGSAVDLTPANSTFGAFAYGVGGGQEVGVAGSHAMLWTGTAASAVDLHPTNISGLTSSRANATDGTLQVGYCTDSNGSYAFLWSGTPNSAVNLNPTNLTGITTSKALNSRARSV